MSWKCEIVTDLAPLYQDKLASAASRRFVRTHLRECSDCRRLYQKYRPIEGVRLEVPSSDGADFALLAKKMRKRRLLLWSGFLSYLSMTIGILVFRWVKKIEK